MCGNCGSCKTKDCGSCCSCQDMIKFRGKGIIYDSIARGENVKNEDR